LLESLAREGRFDIKAFGERFVEVFQGGCLFRLSR
jgi:hypothetical protein